MKIKIKTKLICFVETYPKMDHIKWIYFPWPTFHAEQIENGQRKKYKPQTCSFPIQTYCKKENKEEYEEETEEANSHERWIQENSFAFQQYATTIPLQIRFIANSYIEEQFQIVELLSLTGQEGLDLVNNNRALFWLLASSKMSEKRKKNLVRKKQNTISKELGFGMNMKLLRKVNHSHLTKFSKTMLKKAINHPPSLKILLHLDSITPEVIFVLSNQVSARCSSFNFIKEISETFIDPYDDISQKIEALHSIHPDIKLPTFRSLKHFYKWKDTFNLQPNPIPGTFAILPLTNIAQIIQEGREMNNCLSGMYLEHAHETYLYRILTPERATLEITFSEKTKKWIIKHLLSNNNQRVQDSLFEQVQFWLDFHQKDTNNLKQRKRTKKRKTRIIKQLEFRF